MNEVSITNILDGIMYDEEGNFQPFVGHHGNIEGWLADYRNTYMEAEKEYFSALLSNKTMRDELFDLLSNSSSASLFDEAVQIQERLENGELESAEEKKLMQSLSPQEREMYHLLKLEKAEALMCLLFAAIRDKALILSEVQTWIDRFDQIEETTHKL